MEDTSIVNRGAVHPLSETEETSSPLNSPAQVVRSLFSETKVESPLSIVQVFFPDYGDTEIARKEIAPNHSMEEIASGRTRLEEQEFQKAAKTKKTAEQIDRVVKHLILKTGEVIEVEKLDVGGKVKDVYIDRTTGKAYYIAKGKIGGSKEKELKGEVKTSGIIANNVRVARTSEEAEEDGDELFLNVGIEIEAGTIDEKFTTVTQLAQGDLETIIQKMRFSPAQSLQMCIQIAKALRNLERAGMTHGDLKLENILFYLTPEEDIIVRISDFGKAGKPGFLYIGNTRFMSVEGGNTFEGEVYSAALIMMRILEEPFLEGIGDMLLELDDETVKTHQENKMRRGVERYLTLHKDARQRDVEGTSGLHKVSVYTCAGSTSVLGLNRPKAGGPEERCIHAYIDKLADTMIQSRRYTKTQAKQIRKLLKQMTLSDPTQHPKMTEVINQLKEVQAFSSWKS